MGIEAITASCRLHRGGASSTERRTVAIGSLVGFHKAGGSAIWFGVVARIKAVGTRYKLKLATAYTVPQYKRAYRDRKGATPSFSESHADAVEGLPDQELILCDDVCYVYDDEIVALGLVVAIGVYKRTSALHSLPHIFFSYLETDADFDATDLDKDEIPIRAFGQLKMDLAPVPSTEVTDALWPTRCSAADPTLSQTLLFGLGLVKGAKEKHWCPLHSCPVYIKYVEEAGVRVVRLGQPKFWQMRGVSGVCDLLLHLHATW
jgi:hypothetical protein